MRGAAAPRSGGCAALRPGLRSRRHLCWPRRPGPRARMAPTGLRRALRLDGISRCGPQVGFAAGRRPLRGVTPACRSAVTVVDGSKPVSVADEKVTIEGHRFVIQRERVRTPSERLELELVRR